MGISRRGSNPFLIARYRKINATMIMIKLPTVRLEKAVCESRLENVLPKSIYVLLHSVPHWAPGAGTDCSMPLTHISSGFQVLLPFPLHLLLRS